MSDTLSRLTPLQFLVLGLLLAQEQPGRNLRSQAAEYGLRRSAPAFYQMMARLERDQLVDGWYEPVTVGDQAMRERWYCVTPEGRKQWKHARAFYRLIEMKAAGERLSNAS